MITLEPGDDLAGQLGHPAVGSAEAGPMEFAEVVRRRRMVRNYDPDRPVPAEVIDQLLDYAIRAPSAGFSQGWGFLVLTEPADRERFWAATTARRRCADGWLTACAGRRLIVVPHSNKRGLPGPVRRSRTRAGRIATRRAGRCRTGTSTPGSPA